MISTSGCEQKERSEKSYYNCHVSFELGIYKLVFILFTLAQRLDSHVFPSFFIASHLCTSCCWRHVNINFLLVECNFLQNHCMNHFTQTEIEMKSRNDAMSLRKLIHNSLEQPQNNYLVTFRESSLILNYINQVGSTLQ